MPSIVIDAGPLIALFDGGDKHHARAVAFFASSPGPFVTNLAVVTETCHLLSFARGAVSDFLTWVTLAIEIDAGTAGDMPRIVALIEKYADLPADFADASLVALCERLGHTRIATFDQHFDVYCSAEGRRFENQTPRG